jgi:poly-D-alanine transfer protein DltD
MPVKIQRFFRLGWSERHIFVLASIISSLYSLIILFTPMSWYLKRLGEKSKESTFSVSEEESFKIQQIKRGMLRVRRYLPWRTKCFASAITAKILLKRRKISSTIYLGIAKEGSEKIIAHAWLRSGSIIVTGKDEMLKFTPIVFFS